MTPWRTYDPFDYIQFVRIKDKSMNQLRKRPCTITHRIKKGLINPWLRVNLESFLIPKKRPSLHFSKSYSTLSEAPLFWCWYQRLYFTQTLTAEKSHIFLYENKYTHQWFEILLLCLSIQIAASRLHQNIQKSHHKILLFFQFSILQNVTNYLNYNVRNEN